MNFSDAAENTFVGAGYTHAAVFEGGARFYQPGPYESGGRGHSIVMTLLESDPHYRFYGKGHTLCMDSYFLRRPVQTMESLAECGINAVGTLRKDARNQPADMTETRLRVDKYERGHFETQVF